MKKMVWLGLIAWMALPQWALASGDLALSMYQQEIALTRAALETQRKAVIIQALELNNATEADAFWRVYNAYRADMAKVGDRRVKVIADYADRYRADNIDDKFAAQLLDRYLGVLQDQVKVKKRFVSKFKRVLPAKQVARFYQIDHRLDLLLNMQIADGVPLM